MAALHLGQGRLIVYVFMIILYTGFISMRFLVNFRPDALNVAARLYGCFPLSPCAVGVPRSGSTAGRARDIPLEGQLLHALGVTKQIGFIGAFFATVFMSRAGRFGFASGEQAGGHRGSPNVGVLYSGFVINQFQIYSSVTVFKQSGLEHCGRPFPLLYVIHSPSQDGQIIPVSRQSLSISIMVIFSRFLPIRLF